MQYGGMADDKDWRAEHEDALSRAKKIAEEEMTVMELDTVSYAKKRLKEGLLTAALTMVEIAETSDLDVPVQLQKLRFDASKYLVDRAFGSVSPTSGELTDKEEAPIETFLARCVGDYTEED